MLEETEGGMTFRGPTALGVNAIMEADNAERHEILLKGEELLAQGCVSHNYMEFYEYAIAACLRYADWDKARRYARDLGKHIESEPLKRCELLASRGKLLADFGSGQRDEAFAADLGRLHTQFSSANMLLFLPEIEAAIAACDTNRMTGA